MKNYWLDNDLLPQLTGANSLIAGVDEVGRGALFGPVVAATILLPYSALPRLAQLKIKDSKQLTAKSRRELVPKIKEVVADWQIASASVAEIDRLNILQASLLAMKRAVLQLNQSSEICLVDGNQLIPHLSIHQKNVVQGDRQSLIIGAASILAKVWRDELIVSLASDYPEYDLAANKGYGTKRHKLALRQYGASQLHRSSFAPCRLAKINQ